MNIPDFEFLADLLKQRSGLALTLDKAYLIESRLNPVARKRNFSGIEELVGVLRKNHDPALVNEVTEAMTTNESFFFRDQRPFDQFRDIVLPYLLNARATSRRIRIWSAACSSGQEPYSLAIMLKEAESKLASWNIEILGTDISHEILAKAKEGLYSQFEVQRGLPIQQLVRHFKQEGERWRIDPALRRMVKFSYLNLLDSLQSVGKPDVVFCRNVLIYFDPPTKAKVLNAIANMMAPDGFLYLGGAETVLGTSDRFQVVPGQRGIYCASAAETQVKAAS